MTASRGPSCPSGAGPTGRALWRSVVGEYDLEEHELGLLRQLVGTADRIDQLEEIVLAEGLTIEGRAGTKVHPAAVEQRQLRISYARISAALRLPAGDEADPATARRPQRRSGVRGPYTLRVAQ